MTQDQDVKARVRIDNRRAKGELRELVREGFRTSKKIRAGFRATVGRGLGAVGLGAGLAAGAGAFRAATESGVGDVVGEALGGVGARIAEFFLGDLDDQARAKRAAREETIQAFGAIAGQRGEIPQAARDWFDSIYTFREQEEKGRQLFERDEKFRGPGLSELISKIGSVIGEELTKAVEHLVSLLPFVGSK